MYGEHPNGGMTKVDSCNVNFLKDELPNVGEIKEDLQLYELQLDGGLSLGEKENLDPHHVTENSAPVPERDIKNLSISENQPEHYVHSQSPNFDNEVSPPIQDSGSGSLDNEDNDGSTPLRDKGSGSSSTR